MEKNFLLPCGIKIKNRLVKSAMTEGLADPLTNKPNEKLCKLYEKWSNSGKNNS
jgi:2,4-dienoyl-CoA reductase-like NADH-dependent reductase (Old Yellow Enzyme family)